MLRLRNAFKCIYQLCSADQLHQDIERIVHSPTRIPDCSNSLYFIPAKGSPNFCISAAAGVNQLEPLIRNSKDEGVGSTPSNKTPRDLFFSSPHKNQTSHNPTPWGVINEQKITPEIRRELKALQLRGAANPKRFFKRPDTKSLPNRFHIGYPSRISTLKSIGESTNLFITSEKKKPRSLVSALLRDENVMAFTKKKAFLAREKGNSGNKRSYKKRINKLFHKR